MFRPISNLTLLIVTFAIGLRIGVCDAEAKNPHPSVEELEDQLARIDEELAMTARPTLRSGVGNVGWFSRGRKNSNNIEWLKIPLPPNSTFDQIVLVPALWNDAKKGPRADGFPEAFRILAQTPDDPQGHVILERDNETQPFLPRIAPLILDFPPTEAIAIRIEATRLGVHARDNVGHRLKLAEVIVFAGEKNIALRQIPTVSSTARGWAKPAISKLAMVDGLTPYLMDAAESTRSNPFMIQANKALPFSITIDLATVQAIDGIRLHSAELSEFFPQINSSDFGIPIQFSLQGSASTKWSQATSLLNYKRKSIYEAGNILEWNFPKTNCRHVRLSFPEKSWPLDAAKTKHLISLAEIEILSGGRNVAKDKELTIARGPIPRPMLSSSLTDGLNHFGNILPTREWMAQLARRHELEQQRPLVAYALQNQYDRQTSELRVMSWLVALLIVSLIIFLLLARVLRLRAVMKVRERLAANLHDELSANLHALVLLGDMAEENLSQPEQLQDIVKKIQGVSLRNRDHARHCMQQLQADSFVPDLEVAMRRAADRLLANHSLDLTFEGPQFYKSLPQKKKNDLFLFYQECLVNIARHARASVMETRLTGTPQEVQLIVGDNGKGVSRIPPSLVRRARLLKTRVKIENPQSGGTIFTLNLRNRKKRVPFFAKKLDT